MGNLRITEHNSRRYRAYASFPTPVFSANFSSSFTPEIGTTGTIMRNTARSYFDVNGVLQTAISGNAAIGYPDPTIVPPSKQAPGLIVDNKVTNLLSRSEAPATSPWTAVGTPTVTNDVGTWFGGTMNYGTLVADAGGEGIEQTGIVSIDEVYSEFIFSFYAQTAAGTAAATMQVSGSGATPSIGTQSITVTTTLERFYFRKEFPDTTTGDLAVRITLDGASTIRIGGISCEYSYNPAIVNYENRSPTPGPYVKTTNAAVSHDRDYVLFSGPEITGLGNQWTYSVWWWNPNPIGFTGDGYTKGGLNTVGGSAHADPMWEDNRTYGWWYVDNAHLKYHRYNASDAGHSRTQFDHYIFTVNYNTNTFTVTRNGVLLTPESSDLSGVTEPDTGALGFCTPDGSPQISGFHGIVSRVKIYGITLNATQRAQLYNLEKSNYGL